jgi:hypothetical protein
VDRFRADGFAGTAGILRANVTMNEKSGWFNIELFADIFPDLDEVFATLLASARIRFVSMLDSG